MKIVLVSVSANAQICGVSRHIVNVARCLLAHSDAKEIHVIAAPWEQRLLHEAIASQDTRLHIHAVRLGPGSVARNLWYYSDLPAIATQLHADVVHFSYPAPLNRKLYSCPVVVTLHDLYPYDAPENWGFPKVLFNRLILRQCLRAADAVSCISNTTFGRLREVAPEGVMNKAIRIYNTVEPSTAVHGRSPMPLSEDARFILCIAQHRRNKNILLALGVHRRLLREGLIDPATRLLIVGIEGPETEKILRFVRESGMDQNVVLLSGISEAELQWCYRNCELLLAPSSIEGFGAPVIEALLAGCRIVCSDIEAFRELGGDHCRYVALGPDAEQAFASAIVSVLAVRRPAPITLPQLSAASIAQEFMSLYRRLRHCTSCSQPPTGVGETDAAGPTGGAKEAMPAKWVASTKQIVKTLSFLVRYFSPNRPEGAE